MAETQSSFLTKLLSSPDTNHAYKMGRDYARNGANTTNCLFSLFQTKETTAAWKLGKEDEPSTQS